MSDGVEGYEDIGEEEDWTMGSESPEEQGPKPNKRQKEGKAAGKGNCLQTVTWTCSPRPDVHLKLRLGHV